MKVEEALDSHRFRLEDGRIVQLANVDAPSLADTSRDARPVILQIREYLRQEVVHYPHFIESANVQVEDSVTLVHLFRKYPLNRVSVNRKFLEKGFGFYVTEPKSDHSETYFEAAERAYRNRNGAWNPNFLGVRRKNPLARRIRMMGGLWSAYDADENGFAFLPIIGFSYRISRLLLFSGDPTNYVSLAAEYVNYFIILSQIHIGPEIRIKRRLSFMAGFGAFLIPLPYGFDDAGWYKPCWQISMGVLLPSRRAEFEIGILSPLNDDLSPLIRLAIYVSNPYI